MEYLYYMFHIRFSVQQQTRARRGPITNSCPPLNKTLQMKGRRAAAGICVSVTAAMRQKPGQDSVRNEIDFIHS